MPFYAYSSAQIRTYGIGIFLRKLKLEIDKRDVYTSFVLCAFGVPLKHVFVPYLIHSEN